MSPRSERLGHLAELVSGRLIGDDVEVVDVTHDSRAAGPGVVFVAIRGMTRDGHDFIPTVVSSGAVAVVVDHQVDTSMPQVVVSDTRSVLGPLASAVHGNPSASLRLIGVTGTNGKTSVTHMIEAIGDAAGLVTGLIGTVGVRIAGTVIPSDRTTPEASDFQRLLGGMVEAGADLVASEISSHALALGRVDGTRFAVGAFTNLSQDHLDFHRDMEDYFLAKARLFDMCDLSVVCIDDEWGERLADMLVSRPLITVGTRNPRADLTVEVFESGMRGSRFGLQVKGQQMGIVDLPIPGAFSIANAAIAAACCAHLTGWEAIVSGLSALRQIPGRFELVSGEGHPAVVVDYSHTPAAVAAAIATARPLTPGRVIAVLGAGGDRDRSKRPLMGAAVSEADLVIVTSDNPRSEPPDVIMADVSVGVTVEHQLIEDRRRAIQRAVDLATTSDTVLIMGKGHESYQEIQGVRYPFDDRVVAREALELRRRTEP